MSIQTYYRRALVLPFAVPALLCLFLLLPERWVPAVPGFVMMVLFYSVVLGGMPYLLFAAGFLLWSRDKDARRVHAAALLAPLVYAAVLMVCGFLVVLATGADATALEEIPMLGACGVGFGYFYVLLAELGRVLLRPGPAPHPLPA